jgi:carbamoyl-phosphate synthase large subunit
MAKEDGWNLAPTFHTAHRSKGWRTGHEGAGRESSFEGFSLHLYESVLITGCRFEIGQGLCRILKKTKTAAVVVGADFSTDHPGTLIFDRFELTTPPDHQDYLQSIRRIVREHEIDLIVPMSEAEIYRFSGQGYHGSFEGVPLLTADAKSVAVGQDKLFTAEFLAENGIPHPWTVIAGEQDPLDLPCVIKPRQGNEGEGFQIVDDSDLVPILRKNRPDHIWQELLLPESEEFTCGLFRSRLGEVRSLAIRRRLQGGYTCAGEVVFDEDLKEYLCQIAESLQLNGSINVQLKRTRNGPVAFEINPRFSSTVVFRHLLGFQDFVWAMKDQKGIALEPYQAANQGVRFYRGPREYILRA